MTDYRMLAEMLAGPSTADITRRGEMNAQLRRNRPAPGAMGVARPALAPTVGTPVSDQYFAPPHIRSPYRGEATSDRPDIATDDILETMQARSHGTEAGSLHSILSAIRGALPENPDTQWSALNMARGGLGTMANWASMNPNRIGPEEVMAPAGLGMMTAPLARPAAGTLGMLVGPASPTLDRKTYDKATDFLIDNGVTRNVVQDVFDKFGLHYDPLSGHVGRYASTTDWNFPFQYIGHTGPFTDVAVAPSWERAYGHIPTANPIMEPKFSYDAEGFIRFSPRTGELKQVVAKGPTSADLTAVLRHEMAGHGSDMVSGRIHGLSQPAKPGLAGYFGSGLEQSANMAMLAPAYDDLLRSGRMLWGDINPYNPPAGFLPPAMQSTYDSLLAHRPADWNVTPLDRLLHRLGALSRPR